MNKRIFGLAGFFALIALILNFHIGLAHESITVGDYTLEIGWLSEPPIVGQQNALVINVSTTSDGQPVEDISGLTVTVSYGGQTKTLTLQPLATDTPGQFVAPIIPTVPGEYTVILGGTLGSTTVAADTHVEEVQPTDTLQFPPDAKTTSSGQSAELGTLNWLIYLSLLVGMTALVLAVMALRKTR